MSSNSPYLDLRDYVDTDWLDRFIDFLPEAQSWWQDHSNEETDYGVDSSTIRAMSTGSGGELQLKREEYGPLAAYEQWAKRELIALGLVDAGAAAGNAPTPTHALKLGTPDSFGSWHKGLVQRICTHWRAHLSKVKQEAERLEKPMGKPVSENGTLRIAHKYKLVDLFIRFLRVLTPPDSELGRVIVANAHIPLDMKSISVINATLGLPMSANPSMGDIRSELAYKNYQRLARAICELAKERMGGNSSSPTGAVSPILFDVFAWQNTHAKELYADAEKPTKGKNSKKNPSPRKAAKEAARWWRVHHASV
jgi:hypothetical protein